jgi:hypothetical protein
MRNMRRFWLSHLTVASLAIVTALFFAHLGIEEHPDDCHACQTSAHGFWVHAPTQDYVPTQPVTLAAAPGASTVPAAPTTRGTPPRGPPAS